MTGGRKPEGEAQHSQGVKEQRTILSAPRSLLHLVRNWGPAILWMAVIFWFSAQPDLPSAPSGLLDYIIKKGAHLTVYAILVVLYRWALHRTLSPEQSASAAGSPFYSPAALALSVLYAISDEWHQAFTPGRHPSLLDLVIDFTGALIGLGLWQLGQNLHHRLNRDRPKEPCLPRVRPAHLDEL